MSGSVRVLRPGLHTTIQDLGRWGLQSRGVPVAGPMDPWSHRLANVLVGNRPDAATLEVTLIGPELQFDDDRSVAVVGADFEITIDDQSVGAGSTLRLRAGGRLRVGRRSRGARTYVAIAGGVDVPAVLGSRATHVASRMGGQHGRALQAGDSVGYGSSFTITTPSAASIGTVALLRPGAVTHAIDMNQRYVPLAFSIGSGVLTVTAPPNGNIAPPGYYMLVIANTAGVPSVAAWLRIDSTTNLSPGTILGRVTNASTAAGIAGANVSYSGGSTISNATGNYQLSNVPPGDHRVTAAKTGFANAERNALVTAGSSVRSRAVSFEPNGTSNVRSTENAPSSESPGCGVARMKSSLPGAANTSEPPHWTEPMSAASRTESGSAPEATNIFTSCATTRSARCGP